MAWVWNRFRHTFRGSPEEERHPDDIDQRLLSLQLSRLRATASDDDDSDPGDHADPSLVQCSACLATVHRMRDRHSRRCPLCGHRLRLCDDPCPDRPVQPTLRLRPRRNKRVRSQRSGSDPSIPHQATLGTLATLQLPAIQQQDVDCTFLNNSIGRHNFLGRTEVFPGDLISRPGSETSLPPIGGDNNNQLSASQGGELRAAISAESLYTQNDRPRSSIPPAYPHRSKTREEFVLDVRRATQTGDFSDVQRFYMRTFDTYVELCALFKENPNQDGARMAEPDLKMDFLYAVYDALKEMPTPIHKSVLKSIINAAAQENLVGAVECSHYLCCSRLRRKDEVRALYILIQNPLFCDQSTFVIFAHLLRRVVHLSAVDHQLLVHWLKIMEVTRLRALVRNLMLFISVRQFPTADPTHSLPEPNKMRWWIPTAARVLAFINAANNSCRPPLLHFSELYNEALDHIDLPSDYFRWQDPSLTHHFSYCQYPFILSINAKKHILTKDSEQQQMINARRSLEVKVSRNQVAQKDIFFLNITVRRSHLVEDSLEEIQRASERKELKKKLRLTFVDEPGLDMGGLTKEWFQLLIREIFDPDKGMFVYHPHSRCYWFRTPSNARTWDQSEEPPVEDSGEEGETLQQYNLIGVLMGLAVYNCNILDLHFPSVCYQKLLSPPVVPHADMHLGVVRNPSLDDLAQIMPDVAHGMRELLAYEGDVEQDMCLTFQASIEEFGAVKTFPLKQGGEDIPVTNTNRKEYVRLYLDWMLNTAIYNEFRSFYLGFHAVCASNALIMLRPEEVEMLVCGCPQFVLEDLRKVTEYDGYQPHAEVIENLWSVLEEFSDEMKKKFLLFTTGSDRIPVGGATMMTFKVSRALVCSHMLPQAHTCFNQLMLPEYPTRDILKEKLSIAISYSEGFGLE